MGFNDKKKKRAPKNRQTKKLLVFDETARKEYLTGFKKRKDARKIKGREIAEKKLKEEKRRLKMQKKAFEEKVRHQTLPPDLAEIARQQVQELPEHTVTITDISEADLAGQGGVRLGLNKFEEDEDSDKEEEAEAEKDPSVPKNKQQQQELLNHIGKKIKKKSNLLQPKSKSKKSSKKKKPKRTLSKKAKHKLKRLGK